MAKYYDSNGYEHDNALDAAYFSSLNNDSHKEEGVEIGAYNERYRLYELLGNYMSDLSYYEAYYGAENIDEDDERIQAFLNAIQFATYLM